MDRPFTQRSSALHEIRIEQRFNASHALQLYDGSMEPLHGHVWDVFLHVVADELDGMETVMDFHELERIAAEAAGELDGTRLNDLEAFAETNPSAERVAEHLYRRIAPRLAERVTLSRVTVTEAPGCRASYIGPG